MGQRDPDMESHWGKFRDELSDRFFGKCGYCERRCDGPANSPTVDHFRPKSKFPKLTYEWTNWIFSCKRCNEEKGNLWPDSGFVDPCAEPLDERPESYFSLDLETGEIVVKPDLPAAAKHKAQNTIDCINLNARELRESRIMNPIVAVTTLWAYSTTLQRELSLSEQFGPHEEFAGITRMVVEQLQSTSEL